MKFDPTKFRLPGFIQKLLQNRQMKYVLLVVAFSVLITGAAMVYGALSKQYEQEIRPPVGTEAGSAETANAKKNTADSTSGSTAVPNTAESPEKETDRVSEATDQSARTSGQDEIQKSPSLPGTSQQQTNTEKPNKTENPSKTEKPESDVPNTNSSAAEQQKTIIPEATPPATDDPNKNNAPDFTVLDANGKKIRLSDNFGKPIVINFWATWCPPCKQELPDFEKLHKEYGDRVVFMMVNLTDGYRDTIDGTKRFVSKNGYTFPLYFDTEYSGAVAYNVSSIPQTTFIDANGNVYSTRIGAMNESVLRSYINAMLRG